MTPGEPVWRDPGDGADWDVVGLGQSSLDHVVEVDGLPPFGGKERALGYARLPGGQIATALLACARMGLRCSFVGSVGEDAAADEILAPLAGAGIDLAGVVRTPGATSQLAVILVDRKTGERTVLWNRDPRLTLEADRLSLDPFTRGRLLLLDAGDPDAAARAARAVREAGRPVVLDADTPAPGIDALLRVVDFPVVSREFAIGRYGSPEAAVRTLAEQGARLPVVTLGVRGAVAWQAGGLLRSPAFAVEARDTTGAGDVFHAAFCVGLLDGLPAEELLRFANAAAALACRAFGAQGGLPTREQIAGFTAEARPLVRPEPGRR